MSHLGRWKAFANAAAADAAARGIAQAWAAANGLPYPIPPQSYGAGRQPVNRAAYYHRYVVKPVDNLVPATTEALAFGAAAMAGHVDGHDLAAADRTKLEPVDHSQGAGRAEPSTPVTPRLTR